MSPLRFVLAVAAVLVASATGQVVDGDGSDWVASQRVLPGFYETQDIAQYAELYASYNDERDSWLFLARPRAIGNGEFIDTHIYFNTDGNMTSGYTGAASNTMPATGSDAYVRIVMDWNSPKLLTSVGLYTGCSGADVTCSTAINTTVPSAYIPLTASVMPGAVEFEVSMAQLVAAGVPVSTDRDLGVAANFIQNDWVGQLQPEYLLNFAPVIKGIDAEPACTYTPNKAAVLFSLDAQNLLFQDKAYRQLFMSMQSQLMQAGLPYDRITLDDILNVEESCKYKVIVVPYFAWIDPDLTFEIRKAFIRLVHLHKVGLVGIGDFATNALDRSVIAGDPYFTLNMLFGLEDANPVYASTISTKIIVANNSLSILADKEVGDELFDESTAGTFTNMYQKFSRTAFDVTTVATQELGINATYTATYDSILATECVTNMFGKTSGRTVHFSTLEVAANRDLVWRAIAWAVAADGLTVGVQLTRQDLIFAARNDMDQSQYYPQAIILETALLPRIIEPWYGNYSFVCSYYINLGNDVDEEEYTDWTWAQPLYDQYIALENEIGTHSFTHPDDINLLTDAELEFQFKTAKEYTMGNMSLSRLASAQPGATESLATLIKLEPYFNDTYFSGGYAGQGAGYPGCFGYIDAVSDMVYMAPNMYFDFTAIEFLKWTPEATTAFWFEQLDNATENAKMAIMHLPVHDYALVDWNDESYTFDNGLYPSTLIEPVIAKAYNMGAEFVTGMGLSDRIRAFTATSIEVTDEGNDTYLATISSTGGSLGAMAVSVLQDGSKVIDSVEDWPAYTSSRIFLPTNGGSFRFTLADTASATSQVHITKLAMRMELEAVSSTSATDISFTVTGSGKVEVTMPSGTASSIQYTGADSASVEGDVVTLVFNTISTHTATLGQNVDSGKDLELGTPEPTPFPTAPTPAPTKQPTCGE
ncbi:Hypothetical Protein FCC1311_080942 [Hondaea fermentalgiana]|uniref:Uncharacterized protein n=1 Tax=Hondaea fermentalgiana TaxID=2315210 RepID=A0A2R5GNJ2_9STRA|nr:Hypothetical Protein FCC1311_080942 [Hondaea fermentalgiana]|eukprot:GBG31869.1 Hypothetical Protein FCC1311_080942 [Hondaea fermentalgiana]